MSVFTPIKIDITGQPSPYFFYERLAVVAGRTRVPVSFHIDTGFTYFLRRLVMTWPDTEFTAGPPIYVPSLTISFIDRAKNKPRQIVPIPVSLLSTPAGHQTFAGPAPLPVDNTAFSQNFSASVRPSHKMFNYFYAFADTIEMEVTGFVAAPFLWLPPYFDVMIEGYNIPEKSLTMWGKGGTA